MKISNKGKGWMYLVGAILIFALAIYTYTTRDKIKYTYIAIAISFLYYSVKYLTIKPENIIEENASENGL